MKIISLILLLFIAITVNAQTVKFTNMDKLEQRMENGKDTTYIINFWATWCAPCVAELPHFEKLGTTYTNKPLKILLVSLDFKSQLEKAVIPFVTKHQLKSEVYINETQDEEFINKVNQKWSGAIPATLIINKQKHKKHFYEQEFTYKELEKLYLTYQ